MSNVTYYPALYNSGTISNPIWTPMPKTLFEQTLELIASNDVRTLVVKDADYGSSWKKRGGVGAFMMMARKWDRLETQVTNPSLDSKYDIFDAIEQGNPKDGESVLESLRDLRRYCMLVESEIMLRKQVDRGGSPPKSPPDNDYAFPLQKDSKAAEDLFPPKEPTLHEALRHLTPEQQTEVRQKLSRGAR